MLTKTPLVYRLKVICLLCYYITVTAQGSPLRVATFDSGFGGFFTAKEIERESQLLQEKRNVSISITHYGDTLNAPYGEKTPVQIADLSAKGINRAFDDGADYVFIACNTASTRYKEIRDILNARNPGRGERIISIIDSSVEELRRQIDLILIKNKKASIGILATPATVKAGAYLRALAEAYDGSLEAKEIKKYAHNRWYQKKGGLTENVSQEAILRLKNGKEIHVLQMGPANWVELIEHGASAKVKNEYISRDLKELSSGKSFQVVGQFCTHFPAVHNLILVEGQKIGIVSTKTSYIQQGPLMAQIFRKMVEKKVPSRKEPLRTTAPKAKIFISGDNLEETRNLARDIFPGDSLPEIEKKNF